MSTISLASFLFPLSPPFFCGREKWSAAAVSPFGLLALATKQVWADSTSNKRRVANPRFLAMPSSPPRHSDRCQLAHGREGNHPAARRRPRRKPTHPRPEGHAGPLVELQHAPQQRGLRPGRRRVPPRPVGTRRAAWHHVSLLSAPSLLLSLPSSFPCPPPFPALSAALHPDLPTLWATH